VLLSATSPKMTASYMPHILCTLRGKGLQVFFTLICQYLDALIGCHIMYELQKGDCWPCCPYKVCINCISMCHINGHLCVLNRVYHTWCTWKCNSYMVYLGNVTHKRVLPGHICFVLTFKIQDKQKMHYYNRLCYTKYN